MDAGSTLDYLEFRISASSNSSNGVSGSGCSSKTCELFISSRGVREKVASGSLNTFLGHVRAAREQYAEDSHRMDICLHEPLDSKDGHRPWFTKITIQRFVLFVSAPEVLERVKTIEDELVQLEQVRNSQASSLLESRDPSLGADLISNNDIMTTAPFEGDEYNSISNNVESSKRQLLKAMDIRLDALQQEQWVAFSRAVKAGFETLVLEDLISFAEFFGADRLCTACVWFLELSRKRQRNDVKGMDAVKHSPSVLFSQIRNANGEEIVSRQSISQLPSDDLLNTCSENIGNPKGVLHRTSPRRRSMSPLKKVQVGRFANRRSSSVVIRSINFFSSHGGSKETNSNMEISSSDNDEQEKNLDVEEYSDGRASLLPARRLSVQAAISLFEGKHKDPSEPLTRQRSLRQETCRNLSDRSTKPLFSQAESNQVQKKQLGKKSFLTKDISQLMSNDQNISLKGEFKPTNVVPCVSQESSNLSYTTDFGSHKKDLEYRSKVRPQILIHSEVESDVAGSEMCSKFSNCSSAEGDLSSSLTSVSAGPDISSILESKKSAHIPNLQVTAERNMKLLQESLSAVEHNHFQEEPLRGSEIMPSPSLVNKEALASVIDHTIPHVELNSRYEGRFYQHYQKLRDAKMMEEQQSKRDEREAKLRLMEETLELRKSEMNARIAKLWTEGRNPEVRVAKLVAFRQNLCSMHEPQDDISKEHIKQSGTALEVGDCLLDSSPPSPPLTPRAAKEQPLVPKFCKVKKGTLSFQKPAKTPRSNTQTPSVSPKSTPRELKKENAKLASGKSPGSSLTHPKNSSISGDTRKHSLLECNDSIPIQNNCNNKNTRSKSMAHMRRSLATNGPNILPAHDNQTSLSSSGNEEVKVETSLPSKIRRSAVAPFQEAKPFLRKGSGIGPGAGSGVMKLKVVSMPDAIAKTSDEDGLSTPMKDSDEDVPTNKEFIDEKDDGNSIANEGGVACQNNATCLVDETGVKEIGVDANMVSTAEEITHHLNDGLFSAPMLSDEEKLINKSSVKDGVLLERRQQMTSLPVGFEIQDEYDGSLESNQGLENLGTSCLGSEIIVHKSHNEIAQHETESSSINIGKSCRESLHEGQDNNTPVPKLLFDNTPRLLQREISAAGSASFHANLDCEGHSLLKQRILMDTSPVECAASVTRMGESPVASPISRNSSHMQYPSGTDSIQTHKRCGSSSEKPVVVVVPPKEPAKGLKRLLKFARKGRASPEIILADCLSASTTSEGDDDIDNQKAWSQSVNDLLKSRMQDRRSKDFSDHGVSHEIGSGQSLQSSIPIPPSNFKLRDDHVSGSTRLKAPRSFFSLSNFRSRGSEGKSR